RTARGDVDDAVRLDVRDHGDVLEEVRERVRTSPEPSVPRPEHPDVRELRDDLVEVRPLQLAERPTAADGLVGLVEGREPLRDGDRDQLIREDGPIVLPHDEVFDLLRERAARDRTCLRDVVLVRRQDHAVGDLADAMAGPPDPLDEPRHLPRRVYCNTKSALPTSMPSSRDDVHTRARSRLALKSSSIWTRTSFDRLPWWTPIPGSWYQAVSREERNSAVSLVLTKNRVAWCSLMSS